MLESGYAERHVQPHRLKRTECGIREGFKERGQRSQRDESSSPFQKDPRKARVSSDLQVNRSADAGNKVSIYCAAEWLGGGGGREALNRKRKDALCRQKPGLGDTRNWGTKRVRHLLCRPCPGERANVSQTYFPA